MGTILAAVFLVGMIAVAWDIVKFIFRALFVPTRQVVEVVIRRK